MNAMIFDGERSNHWTDRIQIRLETKRGPDSGGSAAQRVAEIHLLSGDTETLVAQTAKALDPTQARDDMLPEDAPLCS